MELIERLLTLQTQLEVVAPVLVTAGRPSAPVGQDCERIYIWLAAIEDRNFDQSCRTDSRYTFGVEVHSCYTDGAEDVMASVFLADAERFTNLVEAVWWRMVDLKDAGSLAGASNCDDIALEPLVTQPRSGLGISALGAIVV